MNLNGLTQPSPFYGTLLFNLMDEQSRNYITANDFKNGKIQLLSYNSNSKLTYDTTNKAFSFNTMGFEFKEFGIVYNSDTTFISYPSTAFIKAVFVKMPIPLNGMTYSFNNQFTYDAMNSNHYFNNLEVFYLCSGCLISDTYGKHEEKNKKVNKMSFILPITEESEKDTTYYDQQECDSMMKADSLVLINGFKGNPPSYSRAYGKLKTGLLKADGQYKNGYLYNGKYFIYNCEGVLIRICIFKEGKYFADGHIED